MLPLAAATFLVLATPDDWDGLRSRIACAGDVNCDGVPEILVASRGLERERVWLLCGRDGFPFLEIEGLPGLRFGCSLAGLGDVDGDGRADFVIGAPPKLAGRPFASGRAEVYSGGDGSLLHRLESGREGDRFGACVAGGGDADGDGAGDVVVASDTAIRLFSGRTGGLLAACEGSWAEMPVALTHGLDGDRRAYVILGTTPGWASLYSTTRLEPIAELAAPRTPCEGGVPWALACGGDADGDGITDVLVSRIHCGVAVFSGRTRKPLHVIAPYAMPSRVDLFAAGSSLDWIGDLDGDGCDDFAVAASESERISRPSPGFVHVYSGRTGERLHSLPEGKRMDVCRAGDADGDGAPDLAVFVEEDDVVRVVSGADLGTVWEVSLESLVR